MVFSSIPVYLDPSNWQQQQNSQAGATSGNPQFPLPPPPPPQSHLGVGGGGGGGPGSGSIRPGSMADRARMANIPLPEAALKCPRCESTNTKFCYFNNYSLTQPRHFCKTCRRYWTRGGALRSVPVGGGCRRNKRSKGSSSGGSKSPAVSGDRQTSSGNSTSAVSSTSVGTASLLGLSHQIQPPLRFMAPLSQLSEYGIGDIGLMNYNSGISAPTSHDMNMNFQLGSSSLGGGGIDQWRFQPPQISSMANLDFPSGLLYPFHGGVEPSSCGGYGGGDGCSQVRPQAGPSQVASVKMEDSPLGLNLSRQFLGIPGNNDHQFWSTGTTTSAWTDVSGFSSSSNTNPL